MDPSRKYRYMETDTNEWNPNNVPKTEFQMDIGGTVNEVEEYVHGRIERFTEQYGNPKGEINLFTGKRMDMNVMMEKIMQLMKELNWDKS